MKSFKLILSKLIFSLTLNNFLSSVERIDNQKDKIIELKKDISIHYLQKHWYCDRCNFLNVKPNFFINIFFDFYFLHLLLFLISPKWHMNYRTAYQSHIIIGELFLIIESNKKKPKPNKHVWKAFSTHVILICFIHFIIFMKMSSECFCCKSFKHYFT